MVQIRFAPTTLFRLSNLYARMGVSRPSQDGFRKWESLLIGGPTSLRKSCLDDFALFQRSTYPGA